MTTIKSYTDIEQSKKLAEILQPETADMFYCYGMDIETKEWHYDETPTIEDKFYKRDIGDVPCWSLAALLKIIGHYTLQTVSKDKKVFIVSEENYPICSDDYSEPVDACVEMIIKLHKLNIL